MVHDRMRDRRADALVLEFRSDLQLADDYFLVCIPCRITAENLLLPLDQNEAMFGPCFSYECILL